MAVFYVISALGCAFAWSWGSLLVFRIIGGLGIGGSSVLAPMYIAELSPAELARPAGGTLPDQHRRRHSGRVSFELRHRRMNLGAAEWRWMLGIAAAPALLFLLMLFFIPRSPRWLAMKGRAAEALEVLELTGVENPSQELDEIVSSIHMERSAGKERLFQRKYALPDLSWPSRRARSTSSPASTPACTT